MHVCEHACVWYDVCGGGGGAAVVHSKHVEVRQHCYGVTSLLSFHGFWELNSGLQAAQGVCHSAVPAPPPMLFVKESPLQVAFAKDGDGDGDFAS